MTSPYANADRILSIESGGNPLASNPRSSAYGAGQFIDSTWLDMLAKHRPDLTTGRSREELLSLRSDPELSRAMTQAYASDNAGVLSSSGLPVTPGTAYLAHFAGPKGAVGILNADPSASAGSVLGAAAVKANPFLSNMTVADLRAWADGKMGGRSFAPQREPVQIPSDALPPIIPQQAAPEGSQLSALAAFGSMAPKQMELPTPPPIPPPIKRQIDLSRLRAALQRPPSSGAFSLGT